MNTEALDLLYQELPPEIVGYYKEMAQCAIELGYKPSVMDVGNAQ